jgi:Ca-activated chloride channel homolog
MKLGAALGGMLAVAVLCACGSAGLGGEVEADAGGPPVVADGGVEYGDVRALDAPESEEFSVENGDPVTVVGNDVTMSCPDVLRVERIADFAPSDTNAEASATLALAALGAQGAPLPSLLRTSEFANHYAPDLAAVGDQPSVTMELRSTEIPTLLELLVAVQAPPVASRPPVSIVFVIDSTLSMAPHIESVKAALGAFSKYLDDGKDSIQYTTLSSRELQSLSVGELEAQAAALVADGNEAKASIDHALSSAYQALAQGPGEWRRVVLITDGEHTPSSDTAALIRSHTEASAQGALALVLGVGAPFAHDIRSLRGIVHAGRGAYLHLRSVADANQISSRLDELLGVSIDGVRLRLEAPWYFELERAYVVDSGVNGVAQARYLGPAGRLVFPFRLWACAEAAINWSNSLEAILDYTTPGAGAATPVSLQRTLEELKAGGSENLAKTFAVVAYAEALRSFDGKRLAAAFQLVQAENTTLNDPQLDEILTLLPKHPGFPGAATQ